MCPLLLLIKFHANTISDLIGMFLMSYKYRTDGEFTGCANTGKDEPPLGTSVFYPGQQGVQTFLLILALLCVPLMLFPKPFILKRQHQGKKNVSIINVR